MHLFLLPLFYLYDDFLSLSIRFFSFISSLQGSLCSSWHSNRLCFELMAQLLTSVPPRSLCCEDWPPHFGTSFCLHCHLFGHVRICLCLNKTTDVCFSVCLSAYFLYVSILVCTCVSVYLCVPMCQFIFVPLCQFCLSIYLSLSFSLNKFLCTFLCPATLHLILHRLKFFRNPVLRIPISFDERKNSLSLRNEMKSLETNFP